LLKESPKGFREETSNDVFHSRKIVSLPPEWERITLPAGHSTPSPIKTHTPTSLNKHKNKLPPIKVGKGNERLPTDTKLTEENNLGGSIPYKEGRASTPQASNTMLIEYETSSKELSFSHTTRQPRISTFKDTPIGYQPFPSITQQPKTTPTSPEKEMQDENSDQLCLPGDDEVEEKTSLRMYELKENHHKLLESDEEASKVLNKAERYEKLMKVLSLLKQARDLEDKELESRSRESSDQGIHAIREHIKAALDEAVQLRIETVAENS